MLHVLQNGELLTMNGCFVSGIKAAWKKKKRKRRERGREHKVHRGWERVCGHTN